MGKIDGIKHTGTASYRPGGLLQLPSFLMFLNPHNTYTINNEALAGSEYD
ncbi:hypothetical protein E2C01_096829 [Portunus trituberculatus]|uniref:Uncharacterized protein n=1 Tax=Portunus trituberculatus TaxID=210409 RepID=A0A5B7K8B3_PORTR|nr:hypothetical protein [Portunus trituberculatus]